MGARGRKLYETGEINKMRGYITRSPNEILFKRPEKKDECGWAYGIMGAKIGFYGVLVGKLEGNRIFCSSSNRWDGGIITDYKEMG